VAALIKHRFNQDADLQPGSRGEFTVWVDGKKIAEKTRTGFPPDRTIADSVGAALE
jgi:hypothetical protein